MRLFARCIAVLCLLSVGGLLTAAQSSPDNREIGVYVPTTYDPDGEPVPVAIALHGFGMVPRQMSESLGLNDYAETNNMIMVYPAGYLMQWNTGERGDHYEDDVAFLLDLIEELAAEYNIDRERLYLIGFSNGAMMSFRVACEASQTFNAIIAVAGLMIEGQPCPRTAATSVLLIQMLDDQTVPFTGGNSRLSALQTFNYWASNNECDGFSRAALSDEDFSEITGTQRVSYEDCNGGNIVMMYVIPNLPHTWPGAGEYLADRPVPEAINTNLFIFDFIRQVEASKANATAETTPEAEN